MRDSTDRGEAVPASLKSSPPEPLATDSGVRLGGARLGMLVSGSYRLVRQIGCGGMGDVFAAEHVRLGKLFAVKLLRPEVSVGRRAAERLRREARAIAAVSSEYIVAIQDCGETEDGTPFLVMDLLDGEDLRSLLEREGALPVLRAANIMLDACYGLAAAHARSLVHRDLKPENLFITRHATGQDWCKVLDFGVAKMEASQATAPGAIIGTVRYMAPEQLADSARVGPATDVYALGAILYECLCGQPALLGTTMQELMFQVMNQAPAPLATTRPGLPLELSAMVMQCLAKESSERPTLSALSSCLQGFAQRASAPSSGLPTLADEPGGPRLAAPPRVSAGVRLAGLLGFAGLAIGWAVGAWQAQWAASELSPHASAIAQQPPSPLLRATSDPLTRMGDSRSLAQPAVSAIGSAQPFDALAPSASAPPANTGRRRATSAQTAATKTTSPARRPQPVGKFDEANPYQE